MITLTIIDATKKQEFLKGHTCTPAVDVSPHWLGKGGERRLKQWYNWKYLQCRHERFGNRNLIYTATFQAKVLSWETKISGQFNWERKEWIVAEEKKNTGIYYLTQVRHCSYWKLVTILLTNRHELIVFVIWGYGCF